MLTRNIRNTRGWMRLIPAAVAAAALGGCASNSTTGSPMHTASADPQAYRTACVTKGETLTVRLPTAGRSNYAWRLSPASAASDQLRLEERREQVDANGGAAENGEQAWDVFTFRARHTGQVTLEFTYECTWSADAAPSRTYDMNISVMKPGEMAAAMASTEQPSELTSASATESELESTPEWTPEQ